VKEPCCALLRAGNQSTHIDALAQLHNGRVIAQQAGRASDPVHGIHQVHGVQEANQIGHLAFLGLIERAGWNVLQLQSPLQLVALMYSGRNVHKTQWHLRNSGSGTNR
jgi:hypothetical protein